MKTLLIILMLLIAAPAMSHQKDYLPFAKKGKYGKLPTKKARNIAFKQSWRFKQWGR